LRGTVQRIPRTCRCVGAVERERPNRQTKTVPVGHRGGPLCQPSPPVSGRSVRPRHRSTRRAGSRRSPPSSRTRGLVLTQQVGRNEWTELRPFFPRMQDFGPLLDQYTRGFRHAGMIIGQAETHDVRVAYRGLGELVYLLCISPWTIPEFDPLGRDLAPLLLLEDRLTTRDGLVLTESRFLIEARKPS